METEVETTTKRTRQPLSEEAKKLRAEKMKLRKQKKKQKTTHDEDQLSVNDNFPAIVIAKPKESKKKIPLLGYNENIENIENIEEIEDDDDEDNKTFDFRSCLPEPEYNKIKVFETDFIELVPKQVKSIKNFPREIFKKGNTVRDTLKKELYPIVDE